jgi:outer membrane protein
MRVGWRPLLVLPFLAFSGYELKTRDTLKPDTFWACRKTATRLEAAKHIHGAFTRVGYDPSSFICVRGGSVTTSKTGVVTIVMVCAASTAGAQQPITLAEATARALQRNIDIRIDREAVNTADARELRAQGSYDFELKADVSERHHLDPIVTLFSGAPPGEVTPSNTDVSSSVSLNKLFTSGATATASASVARNMTDSFFTLFAPAYLTSIGVQARQPLGRNRATDQARTQLRVTALNKQKSRADLQQQVLNVVASVEQAYWTLVAARREEEVRRDSVTLAEQQRADTQARIDARTAAPLDIAQPIAEVERRRGDYFAARESVVRAEHVLKLLMTDDPADPVWNQTLEPSEPVNAEPMKVDIQRALSDAMAHRPELVSLGADVSAAEAQTALARDALKVQVDLVGGYNMRGLAGTHNPETVTFPGVISPFPEILSGALGTSYGALFNQRFADASIGVSVDVPIGRRTAHGDLGAAEASQRQASLQVSKMRARIVADVLDAATALDTAISRIQAARAGLDAANTQLMAEQLRFTAGTSTNFLVLTRQNDLQQAQLTEISAATQYRRALTEFARATGMLLTDRNITVK